MATESEIEELQLELEAKVCGLDADALGQLAGHLVLENGKLGRLQLSKRVREKIEQDVSEADDKKTLLVGLLAFVKGKPPQLEDDKTKGTPTKLKVEPTDPTEKASEKAQGAETKDLFAVSCFLPLLTHRARELGASPSLVGVMGSIYGVLQFFSSPVMGKLSDRFGRKVILLISLFGAAVGYILTGIPTTLLFLALSRVLVGIFKHSHSIAKTYLLEVSPPTDHADVIGKFNAFSSLGSAIGPLIGGHLAMQSNGFSMVTTLTGFIFLINFLIVLFFVTPVEKVKEQSFTRKEHDAFLAKDNIANNTRDRRAFSERAGSSTSNGSRSSISFSLDLIAIRFTMGFSMQVFYSSLTSMLEFHFNTSQKFNCYILSYSGLVGGFSAILVGKIAEFYNHNYAKMQLHFSLLLMASLLGITFSPSILYIPVFITPLAISHAVCRVCITYLTFHRGSEDEKGAMLGIGNSLQSIARTISPALGGFVQEVSVYGPGSIGALIAGVGVVIMILFPLDRPRVNKKEKKGQ